MSMMMGGTHQHWRDTEPLSDLARKSIYFSCAAAGLLLLGFITPFISYPDDFGIDSDRLSDGGSLLVFTYIFPMVVTLVAGVMAFKGRPWLGAVASGAMVGLGTFALIFVAAARNEISGYDDYAGGPNVAIGFFMTVFGIVAAAIAAVLTVKEASQGRRADVNATWTALTVVGLAAIPVALLSSSDGTSIFDIEDGFIEFAYVVLALAGPSLATIGITRRSVRGQGLAIGILTFFAGLSVAVMAGTNRSGRFRLTNEVVFHLGVAAALTFAVLALTATTVSGGIGIVRSTLGGPSWPPTPAQWAPDPFHRHEYRFWGGTSWTATVSNGGVLAADEPVAWPPGMTAPPPPAPAPTTVPPPPVPAAPQAEPPAIAQHDTIVPPASPASFQAPGRPTLSVEGAMERSAAAGPSNAHDLPGPAVPSVELDEI